MSSETESREVAAGVTEALCDIITGLAHPENKHRSVFLEIRRPFLEENGDGATTKQHVLCRGTFEDLVDGARNDAHVELLSEVAEIERDCDELVE